MKIRMKKTNENRIQLRAYRQRKFEAWQKVGLFESAE